MSQYVAGLPQEILNELGKEFPADKLDQITAKWNTAKQLTVVQAEAVIRRLNEVFKGDVDFTIVSHTINKDAGRCVAHVRITARHPVVGADNQLRIIETSRDGIGAQDIRVENGKPVDIGYDLKSAVTDAIKLAAKLFTVGLYLYEQKGTVQATGSTQGTTQPNNQQQQQQHQFAQPFQLQKINDFMQKCGYTTAQWVANYNLPNAEAMPYQMACEILAGTRQEIQQLEQQVGIKINKGMTSSNAK